MTRTAVLCALLASLALAQAGDPPAHPARPLITVPLDGDDVDTYGILILEQRALKASP